MKSFLLTAKDKYTKCDSGLTLNPLMHGFLFLTLVLSIAFLFFGDTASVQAFVLYQNTLSLDNGFVNLWGIIGLIVMASHTAAFWIRGFWGAQLMRLNVFGGLYLWVWAATIYVLGGFWFQLLVFAIPNIYFWLWYAQQWRKRRRGDKVAFV